MIPAIELTNSVRAIIRKYRLIDTGLLLDTVNVYYTLVGSTCTITIVAQEYFKYHLESVDFEQTFTKSPAFDAFVGRVFSPLIEKAVINSIERGVDYTMIPKMIVKFEWL